MITDPWFYAVAVPAVLLMGISKSGFGTGFGAIAVPLMALAVPVPQAAAILLPVLLVADGLGLAALIKDRDPALVRQLLPAGLVGIVIGTLGFGLLPAHRVAGLVGAITLAFLVLRLVNPPRDDAPAPSRRLGQGLAALSGFTSFIAHAGGPPLAFYLRPLRLEPVTFVATSAVFFAAINLAKWPTYGWLGLIDARNMLTSLVLLPVTPVGVWLGLRFVRHVSPRLFYRLFDLGLLLTGAKLLWDGLH